jgi:hypothetical protein
MSKNLVLVLSLGAALFAYYNVFHKNSKKSASTSRPKGNGTQRKSGAIKKVQLKRPRRSAENTSSRSSPNSASETATSRRDTTAARSGGNKPTPYVWVTVVFMLVYRLVQNAIDKNSAAAAIAAESLLDASTAMNGDTSGLSTTLAAGNAASSEPSIMSTLKDLIIDPMIKSTIASADIEGNWSTLKKTVAAQNGPIGRTIFSVLERGLSKAIDGVVSGSSSAPAAISSISPQQATPQGDGTVASLPLHTDESMEVDEPDIVRSVFFVNNGEDEETKQKRMRLMETLRKGQHVEETPPSTSASRVSLVSKPEPPASWEFHPEPSQAPPTANPYEMGKKSSRGEEECRRVLEKMFGVPFPSVRPKWLTNPVTKMPLELDCYNSDYGIAVEYNGAQHYRYVAKFHNNHAALKEQMYRDQIKRLLCLKHRIHLIEVPYTVPTEHIERFLTAKLVELGALRGADEV